MEISVIIRSRGCRCSQSFGFHAVLGGEHPVAPSWRISASQSRMPSSSSTTRIRCAGWLNCQRRTRSFRTAPWGLQGFWIKFASGSKVPFSLSRLSRMARHEQHFHFRPQRLQKSGDFFAGRFRQGEIGQQQLNLPRIFFGNAKRFGAVLGRQNAIPSGAEDFLCQSAEPGMIFHNQDRPSGNIMWGLLQECLADAKRLIVLEPGKLEARLARRDPARPAPCSPASWA